MKLPAYISALGRSLLVITSLWLVTGPLALLQLGAWAWMISSYSQESSFEQAVRETFGGGRPCEMCKLVTEAKKTETEQTKSAGKTKFKELKLLQGSFERVAFQHPCSCFPNTVASLQMTEDPYQAVPSPPPREFV